MNKLVLTVVLAASLAGCGTPQAWYRDGLTREQFNQDTRECNYEAAKAVGGADATSGTSLYFAQERRLEIERQCMFNKGYRLVQKR